MAAANILDPCTSRAMNFSEESFELNYKMIKPLDEALRCRICFDYYNNCMMTKCSHNYCSVCIRRYMTYKSQCPTCFQDASEPELQNNRLIDEILRLYKKLRGMEDENTTCVLKTPDTPLSNMIISDDTKDSLSQSSSAILSQGSSSDECFTPRVKIEIPDEKVIYPENVHVTVKKEPDFDEVTCPVCYNTVLADRINVHLDNCLKQQFDGSEKRKTLPKLVYHLLTDKEIKRKLKEHGLHVNGDRQTLIRRHKNFITLYNANNDSLNPKPVSELVKEIEVQEIEERINLLPKQIQVNKKSDVSIIEQQQESYLKRHQSQFNALLLDVHQRHVAQMYIKRESKDSFNNSNEMQENITLSDNKALKDMTMEKIDLSDSSSSSSDDADIKKTAMKLRHKRKKAFVSIKNQESPKKK